MFDNLSPRKKRGTGCQILSSKKKIKARWRLFGDFEIQIFDFQVAFTRL